MAPIEPFFEAMWSAKIAALKPLNSSARNVNPNSQSLNLNVKPLSLTLNQRFTKDLRTNKNPKLVEG